MALWWRADALGHAEQAPWQQKEGLQCSCAPTSEQLGGITHVHACTDADISTHMGEVSPTKQVLPEGVSTASSVSSVPGDG